MLITCSECATKYRADPSAVGVTDRLVNCTRCRNVKFVGTPGALSAIAHAYRAKVEAFLCLCDHLVGH